MTQHYQIRRITPQDFDYLYELRKRSFVNYVKEYYGGWNEQEQRGYYRIFLGKYKYDTYIITYNNERIGSYTYKIHDNIIDIVNLTLESKVQHCGIGSSLLNTIKSQYPTLTITLKCFKTNTAILFYRKLGFIIVGETPSHYILIA